MLNSLTAISLMGAFYKIVICMPVMIQISIPNKGY